MTMHNGIRPLDIRRDLGEMIDLLEVAFADEIERTGMDIRSELQSVQGLLPLMSLLARLFEGFRHLWDGFVWEEEGRIVGTITVHRQGSDRTCWEIGTVATHPDYRRRGMARQLVQRAVAHAETFGGTVCVLDVDKENVPAYNLYRSLGFVHYDSIVGLKLNQAPQVQAKPLGGYKVGPHARGEWQARYDLALRETPPEVQAYLPLREDQYHSPPLRRLLGSLVNRLQGKDRHCWGVMDSDRLVGYARLVAVQRPQGAHNLTLTIDPVHQAAIGEPLLTLALEALQGYPRQNTLISMRSSCTDLLALLQRYGFVENETMHKLAKWLVPRQDSAADPIEAPVS